MTVRPLALHGKTRTQRGSTATLKSVGWTLWEKAGGGGGGARNKYLRALVVGVFGSFFLPGGKGLPRRRCGRMFMFVGSNACLEDVAEQRARGTG